MVALKQSQQYLSQECLVGLHFFGIKRVLVRFQVGAIINIDKKIIEDVLAILDHIRDWSDIVYYEGYSEEESKRMMETLQQLRKEFNNASV